MSPQFPIFEEFMREHVMAPFYVKRLDGLKAMRLNDVLKRKNPYLFAAKNIDTAGDLAGGVVNAFLSSQEETLFGNLLEGLAIFVAHTLWNGEKSKHKSLDLEFVRDDQLFLVGIKSGVNWGNSDQIAAMKTNFKVARTALREEGEAREIVAVNGCIYGRDNSPFKRDVDADKCYFKFAGQRFWEWLSGDADLFRDLILPIDKIAHEQDQAFRRAYAAKINELTADFALNFLRNGQIDWMKLVEFVSANETTVLQPAVAVEQATGRTIKRAKQNIKTSLE